MWRWESDHRDRAQEEGSWLTTRSPSRRDELSARERLAVLAVAIFGIGTFFLPLITTGTPIFGRTRWSLFDISSSISAGELREGNWSGSAEGTDASLDYCDVAGRLWSWNSGSEPGGECHGRERSFAMDSLNGLLTDCVEA
jgi:hypothetical protein